MKTYPWVETVQRMRNWGYGTMSTPRIMVIEDDRELCECLLEILCLEGFDVVGVHQSNSAFAEVSRFQPDLILCDYPLRYLKSDELVRQVRAAPHTASIPIVVFSAHSDRRDIRLFTDLGANAYVLKPFDIRELLGLIASYLSQ